MEGVVKKKGTVTPISSLFSPEETQKASERVQEKIAEQHKHLDVLKGFISDNTDLINLVQTLPNELQHQIMVPWGKAAFFPGQLVHTNEFVVLLGDGYYAERTSKQTVEILKRRQKVLESQVESAKAEIKDLKTEASFFNVTADEAASGLVQIVEDYVEERSFQGASNSGDISSFKEAEQEKTGNEDDEYERIMARLSELEKEEEAAENGDENEESEEDEQGKARDEDDDYKRIMTRLAELEEEEKAAENDDENAESEDEGAQHVNQFSTDEVVRRSGVNDEKQLSMLKGDTPQAQAPASYKSSLRENAMQLPEIKENGQASLAAKTEASTLPSQPYSSTTRKAFTGSIVEHTHNLGTKPREETTASSSKPVSRFKMNRK